MKQTLRQAFCYAWLLTLFMRSRYCIWGRVSSLAAGLYMAVLEADGHRLATRKLLVIH